MDESCIVSNFYIKSQQLPAHIVMYFGCIVSNFYIKSQPCLPVHFLREVV